MSSAADPLSTVRSRINEVQAKLEHHEAMAKALREELVSLHQIESSLGGASSSSAPTAANATAVANNSAPNTEHVDANSINDAMVMAMRTQTDNLNAMTALLQTAGTGGSPSKSAPIQQAMDDDDYQQDADDAAEVRKLQ